MMHKYLLSVLLVRVVLPGGLLLSIALRPFGLSLIYLLLFLLAPLAQIPDSRTFNGWRGTYLCLVACVSFLMLLAHAVWHSVLASFSPYGSLLEDYPIIEKIGLNLGLVSYYNIDWLMAVHYIAPELVMMCTSLVVYLVVKKLSTGADAPEIRESKYQRFPLLTSAGKYISLFLIMFSGIMRPSVTSGIYFLVFMGAATAWAVGRPLKRGFAVVGRCVMAIMAVHISVLLAYQFTWLCEIYPPENDMARYFGLTKLVNINETHPNSFKFEVTDDHMWATLASPLVILFTYFVLAIQTRELFKSKLMRHPSVSRKWSVGRKLAVQDSTGSVTLRDEDNSLGEEGESTLMDDIIAAVLDLFQVLIRSSYIATTITMMAWSIMYHSWLTFVLLMWANVVWLCQDQRSFTLKTSPVLVCYAMLLLLAQYIYGMNLYESELPSNITEVNLLQIGLGRSEGEPCVNLLMKSLFTCMFWVTLRQRVQEMRQRRRSAVITDMAAPLQLTFSAAASVIDTQRDEETKSRLLRGLGEWLRSMCARYWIYVVVIMLFVIGITGERMTIFRIIYMFLFLAFILMFQISWYWWRRLMYMFWIVVIIYSMLNLILIYIYQFDNFSKLIETYLRINERLQHDLGLDRYHPADLFVKLLTPTCFLIITIMQVHYFHKDFMALSNQRTKTNSVNRIESSRPSNAGASTNNDAPTLPNETPSRPDSETQAHSMDSTEGSPQRTNPSVIQNVDSEHKHHSIKSLIRNGYRQSREFVLEWTDKVFIYLEINLVKIIFLALMLLCAMNPCALHVPIMILISPALWMSVPRQRVCVLLISTLISVYLMAKMVYQIDYIQHSFFDVNCTSIITVNNTSVDIDKTYNNAAWFGFTKATTTKPLAVLLKGYIALIAVFTFYSLVNYRQQALREEGLLPSDKDKKMFPEISREHADIDLIHCFKYLVNFGFYKFGVEVTLICLMGVIGSRMDVYAVFYAGWLLLLVSIRRVKQAKMWPAFTAFIAFVIPMQYMIAVGFIPQLCVKYPWNGDDEQMKHIRTWLFLPFADDPPHSAKIIFDYILLLFATRQNRVFRIEKTRGDSYPGGSNKEDVGQDWETPHFVNPVPDFLGYVGSWLDIVKRMVFLGLLWITLAIMFMTGTNRVNLFSMGYLIGSFIFLWQGTDFYLRPKDAILRWWSWLVRYNVGVVVVKTVLQIPGCIFSEVMQNNACWLVQLLGIGCVDKFVGGNLARFLKMHVDQQEQACSVPQEDIGLAWDGVCFAFLILQRRLFHSYYFYRVIDESKATTVLASRGAELIEELRQKQMNVQEETEKKILEKIKLKMERIKANQKKVQGAIAKDPIHHDAGSETDLTTIQRRVYAKRHEAVRSGDYYMFDEFDDTEHMGDDHESSEDEDEPKQMGFGRGRRAHSGVSEEERPSGILREPEDVAESETDEFAVPIDEKWIQKVKNIATAAWAFTSSILISLTRYLMKFSRDYRYVSKTLSAEKKKLKEKPGFGIGIREGSQMIWEPLPENLVLQHKDVTVLEEQDDSMFKQGKSSVMHLIYSLWFAVLAHTDIVCYIMVFINQIQSATILSIPLPLMVFLWGTLTIPRPTKTFWVTLIAYTEVIVLIKSMFQFEILPWNQKSIPANMPFTAPRIIGIERKFNYALYDLLLLLIIFLHRFMLKSLGLWKESSPEIELREDVDYDLTPEDTQKFIEGNGEEVGQKYVVLHDQTGPENNSEQNNGEENEAGPSHPDIEEDLQELYRDREDPVISVTTTLEKTYGHYPEVMLLAIKRYLRPMHNFFTRMLAPGARVTADVYAYMFLCDFINFMVVIFGFAAFGTHQGDGGVQAYLEENKVPIPFLIMLILQFGLIIIDRALYLRKYMLGKILFQYGLIIGVHIWMFFVLPFITERTFNTVVPPPMWYMIKCIYLLLSAYQIRCGYPRRIIGNFLCKSYGFINMVCFRGFMAVPFVFELRTLMDWIWTDTSMTLLDWLKMEDIFASVFLLKCSRYVEDEFPQPRGQKKSSTAKYLLGGGVLAFVIAIIWFPLVFFAFGNSVGIPNPPTDVTVKIRIGPFLPVFQMSAQSHNIHVFTEQDFTQLSNIYARDRTAQTFLSNYMYNDVAVVTINPNSTLEWIISPPELQRLRREAMSNSSLQIKFTYVITHPTNAVPNPPTIDDSREMEQEAFIVENNEAKSNPARETLSALLNGTAEPDAWVDVKTLFPKFLKVFNKGSAKAAHQLMPPIGIGEPDDNRFYRDVQMRLERVNNTMYWRVRENCARSDPLTSIPFNNCDMLVMYTFNDKLFPETLNIISGSGIIGLYTTFVFLASRVLRGFFSGIYTKIMFDDLPNVDRVLQLCLDIYLVREALELTLEEDLFAKLVFLYRSPETMIKWSRPKEEPEMRALPPSH